MFLNPNPKLTPGMAVGLLYVFMHRRPLSVALIAGLVAIGAPLAPASADLVNMQIIRDDALAHQATLDDAQLSTDEIEHRSANWEWKAVQRQVNGRWVIVIRLQHRTGPHSGDRSTGNLIYVYLGDPTPGGETLEAELIRFHPDRGHRNTVTMRYEALDSSRSRLKMHFRHDRARTIRIGPPWTPVLVGTAVSLASFAMGWFGGRRGFRRQRRDP